ncbi:restriction endonuclease subunit S [Pseudomonas stutzeri]|uniref:restriction endonuclease subunit S n=1 Tax=Stutzerimonas stutzeri TaxID=316 RepID=UPI00210B19D9|nr:restriction endonuclease subunit S [Stutzerimonas stutzeri]MCQ4230332.1 restriction endonuclease subunit S [Stutzerimonas stutzeri]
MSHYKPYPAYKDSGVEWLGQVPEHWGIQRIKSLIDSAQNGIWGDDPDGGADDIPCARVADFDRNSFTVKGELPTLRKVPEAQRLPRQVNSGDLLIEKSGGGEQTTVGVVVQYQGAEPVICSNFVAVVKPKQGVFARWLCYTNAHLYSVGVNVRSIKQTTGIQNIDSDQYFSERVAVPPERERQIISAHLDRETARIDALVAKKTRFIELLREKRQALITHAVTKGLDPNVKMKDSGVEWLGEVPEHWLVTTVSRLFEIKAGGDLKEEFFSDSQDEKHCYPIYTNSIRSGAVYGYTCKSFYLPNSITVTGRGEIGYATYRDHPYDAIIRLLVLTPKSRAYCKYSAYFINAVLDFHGGNTAVSQLSAEQIAPYPLISPPEVEQLELCDFLDQETSRIDVLIGKTERSIELLKERRSALITAAVTGQIDLREAV